MFSSCEEEKHYYVKNVGDGESVPSMSTLDVKTFISDSGYTKYFIKTPIWNMYEEAQDPFWLFPNGLEMEQYNINLQVESTMRCDSAKYLSQQRIWRLDGNVIMVNVARDTFLTNQVFWDQNKRKVYSDSFIHIVKEDRIIEGYGFDSNETMTAYVVNRPTGIFPVNEESKAKSSDTEAEDPEMEYNEDVRRAQAPKRASERNAEKGLLYYSDPVVPNVQNPNARPVPQKLKNQ